ncbi:MAG: c-type cytochrome [Minwuia sp.]|uniref:c-type cytochrome n=1 Tax=Minwuia sp. TaxID=2493630 RepID=UPI003A8B6464
MRHLAIVCSLGLAVLPQAAAADGDPEKGREIYEACSYCHDPLPNRTMAAPDLGGVIGRPAGALPGFEYSDALKDLKTRGVVWTEENLHDFIRDPRGYAPGTVMPFKGVKRKSLRDDLFAYLKTLPVR